MAPGHVPPGGREIDHVRTAVAADDVAPDPDRDPLVLLVGVNLAVALDTDSAGLRARLLSLAGAPAGAILAHRPGREATGRLQGPAPRRALRR